MDRVNQIKSVIKSVGGCEAFTKHQRYVRPRFCPKKNNIINELQSLSEEEIYIAFRMKLIGNSITHGVIIKNIKK